MFQIEIFREYLEKLRWARFRLTYRAKEKIIFPEYKGSTFRGPFGHAFRRLVCTRSEFPACLPCPIHFNCPYAIVFESSPPPNSLLMKDFSDSPRPFIIEPDLDPKTEYLEGEHFFFDLVIFGDAIQFFPYFVLTFRELTSQGIGKTRGKAALERIDFHGNGETKTMYREQDGLFSPNFQPQTGEFLLNGEKEILKDSQDLTVRFKTMTRLQYRGHLVEFPHFHILFRNLVRRISALLFLYHGSRMELDYSQLFSLAEKVDLKNNLAVWVDWARYSRRQQKKMFMGGLIGEATYCLEKIEPDFFLPFLIAGQVTHVGKGTVFGLGKYEIV